MADPTVSDPFPPNPNLNTTDFDSLPIPPLDPTIFSQDLTLPDNFLSFDDDLEDFDFTFDDTYLPSDTEDFLNSTFPGSDPVHLSSDPDSAFFNQTVSYPELCQVSGDQTSSGSRFLNPKSPALGLVSDDRSSDVSGFLNVPSPDSGGFNRECSQESGGKGSDVPRFLNCSLPEVSGPASSQGSGNCGSAGSEALNYPSPDSENCARSVSYSQPNSANNSINEVIDQKIKFEELGKNCLLKRKKENGEVKAESRNSKFRRPNAVGNADQSYGFDATNEDEEKKKARLMRNRESAQLSRQRKKHYVEELEDKVRAMHSTIQDLNTKISYIVAENASLRQQLSGGAMCPPQVSPPGMYPHPPMAPMAYPWMPCPPYLVKSQGSQVPLVPIPRLKPQQPVSAPKAKKVESKKTECKTKKVASVSFVGLLFFILLFGGLVPMVNVKSGGLWDAFPSGSDYVGNRFYDQRHGRVLTVIGHPNGTNHNIGMGLSNETFGAGKDFTNTLHCGRGHVGGAESDIKQKERGLHPLPSLDELVGSNNASEPLVASLYVPRNDKLVKIDGNLIIHSVMASEKAMASHEDPGMKSVRETGLAVAVNSAPAISIPGVGRNNGRHPHLYTERQRALATSSVDKDNLKSADGKLQQWFREGLAGPMLSSGMCTEVFHFDVSPASAPGAIVSATSIRNISAEQHRRNSTHLNHGRNRRILRGLPIPLPGSVRNISKEQVGSGSQKENSQKNNSLSSMVVSVLVDPREGGDGENDGVMGTKSLSRIFVVVLIDSVKYVTYSCMLPLMGSSPHLVTT